MNRLEWREILKLLQNNGFDNSAKDGRPIKNVWSPKYLGGRPGSED